MRHTNLPLRRSIGAPALAAAVLAVGSGPAWGRVETKLLSETPAVDQLFGFDVAISGDIAAIGGHQPNAVGAVYVFRFNDTDWVFEQRIEASDGDGGDEFGSDVAISDGVIIVGANDDNVCGSRSGSAYVYRFNGTEWEEEQKLWPSDCAGQERFGNDVAVSGDVAIVGKHWDNTPYGYHSGSAYVFRYNGAQWVEEQKLVAWDGAADDGFGGSVTISCCFAIVSSPRDDDNGPDSGSLYVFRYNGTQWVPEQKLTAQDGQAGDKLGYVVKMNGDVAIAGAHGDDDSGLDSGSAYVFRCNGTEWRQEQKILASDGEAYQTFGISVGISGDLAVVGADERQSSDPGPGAAYVYRYDGSGWVQQSKLTASDGASEDYFGWAVAIRADVALIGAHYDDDNDLANSGSAYVYGDLIRAWGCGIADVDGDGDVGVVDFLLLLGLWGSCP